MDLFLWAAFALIIIVVAIVVIGIIVRTAIMSVNRRSFEELVTELKEDNAHLKAELAAVREDVAAISKILKEVE